MINKILKLFLKLIFWLAGAISSVVLFPIYQLLTSLMENFPDYIDLLYYFFNNNILPIIPFCREVFFNVTGLPRELFNALIVLYLTRLSLHFIILAFRFLIKMYYILRGASVSATSE